MLASCVDNTRMLIHTKVCYRKGKKKMSQACCFVQKGVTASVTVVQCKLLPTYGKSTVQLWSWAP